MSKRNTTFWTISISSMQIACCLVSVDKLTNYKQKPIKTLIFDSRQKNLFVAILKPFDALITLRDLSLFVIFHKMSNSPWQLLPSNFEAI